MAAAATAATAEIVTAVTATTSEMEATATAITTAAAAGPPPAIPEKYMHKNRLQSFSDRMYKKPPIYKVESEGEPHQPKFRCTVEVGGQQFSSAGSFDRKKEAEQDAARVAYEILAAVGEDDIKEAFGLIDQDAEQNAARAVIKSILAKHNTCMVGIVRSKKQLITAVRSSGSTPATFTPIEFTRPVSYAAYGGPDHVAPVLQNASSSLAVQGGINAVPAVGASANPSSANVSRSKSKKRKARV